jgi:hypothetical protein
LNPHPFKTLTDKISLKTNPSEMVAAKSYVNCTEDNSLPITAHGPRGCGRNWACSG